MRLFVAIDFSDEIKTALIKSIHTLKENARSGTYPHPDNLHLTLAFIGETSHIQKAKDALAEINVDPFPLTTGGLGRFGRDLYWIGVQKHPALLSLADRVIKSLTDAEFPIDKREFQPHITIGRKVVSLNGNSIDFPVPSTTMMVTHIELMKSERIGGKLIYTPVFRKDFKQ